VAKFIYQRNPMFYSSTLIRYGSEAEAGPPPSQERVEFEADFMMAGSSLVQFFKTDGDGKDSVGQLVLQPGEWVAREDAVVK